MSRILSVLRSASLGCARFVTEAPTRRPSMTRTEANVAVTRPAEQTLRLIPRLTRWAQARVVDDDEGPDLSLRQLSALQMIQDDETTTLGDVARRLMVTPAVVTGLID